MQVDHALGAWFIFCYYNTIIAKKCIVRKAVRCFSSHFRDVLEDGKCKNVVTAGVDSMVLQHGV